MYGLVLVVFLIVNFCCTSAFVRLAAEKGYSSKTTTVWLLGIFGSILTAGLYVAALPVKADDSANTATSADPKDELPAI